MGHWIFNNNNELTHYGVKGMKWKHKKHKPPVKISLDDRESADLDIDDINENELKKLGLTKDQFTEAFEEFASDYNKLLEKNGLEYNGDYMTFSGKDGMIRKIPSDTGAQTMLAYYLAKKSTSKEFKDDIAKKFKDYGGDKVSKAINTFDADSVENKKSNRTIKVKQYYKPGLSKMTRHKKDIGIRTSNKNNKSGKVQHSDNSDNILTHNGSMGINWRMTIDASME